MRKLFLHILMVILLAPLAAQEQPGPLSNLRRRLVVPAPGGLVVDSLPVIPSSLRLTLPSSGAPLDTAAYRLDRNRLTWRRPVADLPDSLLLSYRVLPYDLRQVFRQLDTTRIRPPGDTLLMAYAYNPFAESESSLIDFRGLDYNGNFARGISFGNRQDLVLNSSFNLQLAGDLGEGVEILAAISDENIPLQPEGNTQQLQEFDKVFIQLKKDNNQLTAGDYELRPGPAHFMNYFKKLQGATFSHQSAFGEGTVTADGSIAVARGQFARQVIEGQEGNQGPYKLRGAQNERFIIVLSGTERVWLDGQLLRRGLEEDYIIDYNRGEIVFSNRRLITKDSRIIMEFEYSSQNYLRTLYAFNTDYRRGGLRLYANLLNQQDSKTSTGLLELSADDKQILAEAGDDPTAAVAPGIDTLAEFNPQRAMYVWHDTLTACGQPDSILVYSTDAITARLTARFSFVGAGNGNYVLDPAVVANERVYRWVPPDPVTCEPGGDYEPVIQLGAPQRQLLFTTGAEYRFSSTTGLRTEVALSHLDLNRFSSLDANDDNGLALFSQFDHQIPLGADENDWQLTTDLAYEFVHENFRALNPYRNPEFLRDWSLADKQGLGTVQPAREHLLQGSLTLRRADAATLQYRLSTFHRDSLYAGWQHAGRLALRHGGLEIDGQASFLTSEEPTGAGRFLRPRLLVTQTIPWLAGWQVALYGEMEKNDRFDSLADTLNRSSFFYHLLRSTIRSPERERYAFEANYTRRNDYLPDGEDFRLSTAAAELNANGRWQPGRAFGLSGNLTYRDLDVADPQTDNRQPAQTWLGRTDATLALFKGALRSGTTYELGSGQEPKLQFTYIRVNRGEGTHIWLDSLYNNDGVVQPNEMEIAPFPDQADFIKITSVSDEFIRTNYVNLNQTLQLNPRAVWFNAEGLRKLLARFSTQSTYKISRKTQAGANVAAWNPFPRNIADSALVAATSNIRHVIFFNRADPAYDLQFGVEDNASKLVQTTGFESRRTYEQYLRGRWNLSRVFSTQLSLGRGRRLSDSEFFNTRDYRIESANVQPQLTFLPADNFRAILSYKYQHDRNTLPDGGEAARQHDFNLEATYNRTTTTSIRSRLSLVNIDFTGRPNSPVGFAILNGLAPGRNFLWNLSIDRQIARNLQLRFSYEGRKTGTAPVVHIGRAQVAATF